MFTESDCGLHIIVIICKSGAVLQNALETENTSIKV